MATDRLFRLKKLSKSNDMLFKIIVLMALLLCLTLLFTVNVKSEQVVYTSDSDFKNSGNMTLFNDILADMQTLTSWGYIAVFMLTFACGRYALQLGGIIDIMFICLMTIFLFISITPECSAATYEDEVIVWDTGDNIDDDLFIDCTIYAVEDWVGYKYIYDSRFYECIIYSNLTSLERLYVHETEFENVTFQENGNTNTLRVYFRTNNYLSNVSFIGDQTTDFNFRLEIQDSNIDSYFYNISVAYAPFTMNTYYGYVHLYNFTHETSSTQQVFSYDSHGAIKPILMDGMINIDSPYDYILIENISNEFSYNLTNNSIFPISVLYVGQGPLEWKGIEYSVSGWINNVEIELNNMTFYNGVTYEFVVHTLITLTLDIRLFNDDPINNVAVSIKNNDSDEGYFLVVDGIGNINVKAGNLFFHISQTDDDLETKTFELELTEDSYLIIYMNMTDVIGWDLELINHEHELRTELAEQNQEFYMWLFTCLVVFVFVAFMLYKLYCVIWRQ